MWWQIIVIVVVLVLVAYMFSVLVGFNTKFLTRRTHRKAEDLYPDYADTGQRRHLLDRHRAGDREDRPG